MIKVLEKHHIDYKKWDQCIAFSKTGLPYAYSWYLDIICDDYIGLVEGDYKAVMPLPIRHKWGIKYIYTPYFSQQLGVFSANEITVNKLNAFIDYIPSDIKYVDQYLNLSNLSDSSEPAANGYIHNLRHTSHIDLSASYDSLYQSYSKNTKRNLKKAAEFTIEEGAGHEGIIELFRAKIDDSESGLASKDFRILNKLMQACTEKGIGRSLQIKSHSDIAAAVFYLETTDKIIWLFPASNEKYKEDRPLFFLLDLVIKENAESGKILDLEGSMIPSIQRFYEGFSAEKVNYAHLRMNRLPWYLKWMKK